MQVQHRSIIAGVSSWWKEQKGARLDLDSGEWDKDQFRAEVENHDYIQCVKDDRRKMKNT